MQNVARKGKFRDPRVKNLSGIAKNFRDRAQIRVDSQIASREPALIVADKSS